MKTDEIRKKFLSFFEKHGHRIVSSDTLIPTADPTLLFTSAGMVQFKKHFLGEVKLDYTRASSSQRCFRTSDIERVGQTIRHLTFFEMLGNFSFGDYFKKEAINWAWEFLTEELKMPPANLYATVFNDDREAFDLWKKILPGNKILRLGEKTNFWRMGETGPCGPCSEILLDLGAEKGCGKPDCGPACDCSRWLEVWNLVFTQFDCRQSGELAPLPKKNIDTGLGLERLAMLVQGVDNVFEIDLFKSLIQEIAEHLDRPYGRNAQTDVILRTIADHCRAITFLISDGILPANEGRGYVLRRILRRAVRQAKLLPWDKPFLYQMVGKVVEIMKNAYPELETRRENIALVVKMEEEKFIQTLESGSRFLFSVIDQVKQKKENRISGEEAFSLYETYGFPLELTREIAGEEGLSVDEARFAQVEKASAEKSRRAWKGSGEEDTGVYGLLRKKVGETVFKGYDFNHLVTKIVGLLKDHQPVDKLLAGENGEVIFSETPFYGESGGQIGDQGLVVKRNSSEEAIAEAEVVDTTVPVPGLIAHSVKIISGELAVGDKVGATLNEARRQAIRRHHSVTHLLQKALRQALGTHVAQSGSLVTNEDLRFDFTHFSALKKEELKRVEEIVNWAVVQNFPVITREISLKEAQGLGAMALFGEKYGEQVRCVMMTDESWDLPEEAFSVEVCGGTHVRNTGEIGLFKITGEFSVGSGLRRIEAKAGLEAYQFVSQQEDLILDIAEKIKSSPKEILIRLDKILQENHKKDKEIEQLLGKTLQGSLLDDKQLKKLGALSLVVAKVENIDEKTLRQLGDQWKEKIKSGIIVLGDVYQEKAILMVIVTEDLIPRYHAGKLIKEIITLLGGSGGGRPDMAQAGSKNHEKLDEALSQVETILKKFK
ncbi:MAG: alanine--tRNA ligase [Elusimicrobiota bacterium]